MKYFTTIGNRFVIRVYRTYESKFSNGEPTTVLNRFSWDFENWSGHIHNHEETRKRIKELDGIKEITKEEAEEIISYILEKPCKLNNTHEHF